MSQVGQLLLGGFVGGGIGSILIQSHSISYQSIAFQLRGMMLGRRSYEEYVPSSPFSALVDARAWNRLVLDVHAVLLRNWPK
mmetsp:Transcript_108995/g.307193  ORF Transcript_108995/g.307193 Transcript_108995/m.307193 type:complete len:82 (-) Transcript_108995:119-364(-)